MMTKNEIKQTLEKFKELFQSNLQLNNAFTSNIEAAMNYCDGHYKPEHVGEHLRRTIIEASDACFQLYVNHYNRSNFDSSIYALCALGAAYGADKYMYENGVSIFTSPLHQLKNGGLNDSDLGEIDAFQNLCELYGLPRDFSQN